MSSALQNDEAASAAPGADNRFQVIFDSVNDGIFISDPKTGQFTDINEAGARMFGYPKGQLLGQSVDALSSGVHPYTTDVAIELNEKARLGEPQIFEWLCKTKDGVLFATEISLRYTTLNDVPSIVAIFRDISERKRLDAEIVYMAQHDVLTGLANRAMFTANLDRAIANSLRTMQPFALLGIDLDHFKDVNDTRGHLAGDRLLRLVAERLRSVVRGNENVARFGGDEFAILLEDIHEPGEIAALASRIIAAVGKPFQIDGAQVHVGASIGVAIYGEVACDAETLLSQADIALYRAKAEGRQSYRFYSDAMNEDVRASVALTGDLRQAIAAKQFFLVYQPQVRVTDGAIIGVEALVRWRHPRRGILAPADFLEAAEGIGVIGELGQWVLREACLQAKRWLDAGIGPGPMAVNLSSAQFKAPLELERVVIQVLAETGLPANLLELEITETTLINLSPQNGGMIQRLRRAGVRFSLDDFGTGYSSLNYLRRFTVDRIKIAREFIADLAISPEAAAIVKLILALSRDLGSETMAEGVETTEQISLLHALNCQDVQGFYFAAPMLANALAPLLTAGTILHSPQDASVASGRSA
jgi:diguanylate cyclase (GGDEF)-like protein/PAS domain S-box-containing protein